MFKIKMTKLPSEIVFAFHKAGKCQMKSKIPMSQKEINDEQCFDHLDRLGIFNKLRINLR